MFEDKPCTLYRGDCLTVMGGLIEKNIKVDMVLTDLPYGTTNCRWDSIIPFDKMWNTLNELINTNTAVLLFGNEPFSSALRLSNIKNYKYDWKWKKPNGTGFLNAKKQPLRVYEDICVFYKKQCNYFPQMREGKPYIWNSVRGQSEAYNKHDMTNNKIENEGKRFPINVIEFGLERGLHPTQKPTAILEYLIQTYTNENDVVLDFTMGSGSTGVACMNTNRKFIGIELDDTYFDIAEKRISEALKNKGSQNEDVG